jgi:hypothetical protein
MVTRHNWDVPHFSGIADGEYPVLIRSPLYIGQDSASADLTMLLLSISETSLSTAAPQMGNEDIRSSDTIITVREFALISKDIIASPGITVRANKIGFI